MMEISINGDFTQGRKQMTEIRKSKVQERNKLERERKKKQKENQYTGSLENRIKKLDHEINMYSVSKMMPTRHNNRIVINGKLLQDFIKKLKGFHYTIEDKEQSLKLKYGREYGKWTGELELFDLSNYFAGFTDMPELETYDFLD